MENYDLEVLVYHFDKIDKFFIGSDKADLDPLEGKPMVPASATLVAPPAQWSEGDIPIFNGTFWEVCKDNFWRPDHKEINFDAGREMSTWQPKAISISDFPNYPSCIRLTNSQIVVCRLVDNIRYVDAKFQKIIEQHANSWKKIGILDDADGGANLRAQPTPFGIYKFECEALVFHIRHCLDTLCRLTELLVDANKVNEKKKFSYDCVGHILNDKAKKNQIVNIILGSDPMFEADKTEFLDISNKLFNAMKHSHMNAETMILYSTDCPTISAFDGPKFDGPKKYGSRHVIAYHNHNSYHLMMGFHDTIDRIINNQKVFLKSL